MLGRRQSSSRVRRTGLAVVVGSFAAVAALVGGPAEAVPQAASAPQAAVATKYVYLTFDDGPHPQYTAQVLDILQAYNVRATFFQVGRNVASYPYLTRRAHLRGNSVQNHSWSHVDLRYVSYAGFRYQILTTDRYIRAQTGYTPRCLRPPYGAANRLVYIRAAGLGKTIRLWSVDPRDWSRPGTSVIVRRVLDNVQSGSVVLLHDGGGNRSQTVAALPTILRTLKARGYVFYRLTCG
jgi:peptidoglycan/xylan/chitin deacetylase (PgdA/CDA1 family)